MNTKIMSKILIVFIFIQLSSIIFATDCFQTIPGVTILQDIEYTENPDNEYIIRLDSDVLGVDLNFVKLSNAPEECENRITVLEIEDGKNINWGLGAPYNKRNQYINGIDVLRIKDGLYIHIVNAIGSGSIGLQVLDINVSKIEITSLTTNNFIQVFTQNSEPIGGGTFKLKFNNLVIKDNSNLSLTYMFSTIGTNTIGNSTIDNVDGTTIIIDGNAITNIGDLNISGNFSGNGGKDTTSSTSTQNLINGGNGGKGGDAIINLNYFINDSTGNSNIKLNSGKGGNGSDGHSELISGSGPSSGGNGGNGGDIHLNIENIYNQGDLNISLETQKGGNGGNAGHGINETSNDSEVDGGNAGNGGNIYFDISKIENNGRFIFDNIADNGGTGGDTGTSSSNTHLYYAYGLKGKGGTGGEISDLNISKLKNTNQFYLYSIGGEKGYNGDTGSGNPIPKAGSVGSVNIDYLINLSDEFNIKTKLNETETDDICGCFTDCDLSDAATIGNININYLSSGSFLPKRLEIVKLAPANETSINISGCYAESIGVNNAVYFADKLTLRLSNLATIAYDFDSVESRIGYVLPMQTTCPVCDSIELNNPTLRTDTEYTIYTDTNLGEITDLNIYYINPDGNQFNPSGETDQNYVIYSLVSGETIDIVPSVQFVGTNIKAYKISKDKLYYNPEAFALTEASTIKDYDIEDIKLFCPGQRYLLRFKLATSPQIKDIYFTPLFNID